MNISQFKEQFQEYLVHIEEAKLRKAHHDQLRSIFIGFLTQAFNVRYEEFELEKGVKAAKVRGFIDALYQDIVFEFKRDLDAEREKGKTELTGYLQSLRDGTYFGVLTDGLLFEVYILKENRLDKTDSIFLKTPSLSAEDAFVWFDSFLFSEKGLAPTAQDVVKKFGDTSPVFNSSFQRLTRLLTLAKGSPSYQVKFQEWDKLLAKAYGHSVARDELFLRHTYLSLLVKLLAYAALFKAKPKGEELREVITGKAFVNLPNFAEEDFFCWVLASPLEKEALELLRGLAQHLAIYDLSKVNQDLLKELYENLVDRETKHDLGEVYTPDWLVELTLREAGFGKGKSLLDPACGSGTFLFMAIRLLREQGLNGSALVDEALQNIFGVDVHPLAVTIAKVNYVLALAPDLKGYGKTVVLPVYMADSLQAGAPVGGELVTIWVGEKDFFNIPRAMAGQPGSLDQVIDEMRKYVGGSEDIALDGFSAYLSGQGYDDWVYMWRSNLKIMRKLIKEGRDTIWAFILKNYYRPAYLRQHPFDIVAGNPPWLSYRYITDPGYQRQVKELVFSYGLLTRKEVKLFTQMEVATLFFAFSADIYLKKGGAIAFVMPRSVLTGAKQHRRFQELLQGLQLPPMALEKVLDLGDPTKERGVYPLFKVGSCVLIAQKQGQEKQVVRSFIKGTLSRKNLPWSEAKEQLTVTRKRLAAEKLFPPTLVPSPYLKSIKAGASIYPRCFWFVQPVSSPYGINQERPMLETSPEVQKAAKKPWHDVHLHGEVESQYLYTTMLSRQLLPFGFTNLNLVVLPVEDSPAGLRLVNKETALAKGHTGLHNWLSQADALWKEGRKERSPEDVYSRLDYQHLLTSQHSTGYYTVLYGGAGTNLASCVLNPQKASSGVSGLKISGFIADIDTFLYQTKNEGEAQFLCALLNCDYINRKIKDYQTRGAWGERHIYRRPFEVVSIPKFNPDDERHLKLAELSEECHQKVARLAVKGKSIGFLRNKVRQHLSAELDEIDKLVKSILS